MTYGTATITSATPAKDLMAALKTPLTTGGMTFVESYGSPVGVVWTSVTSSGSLFVAVATGTSTAATSPDGITWTQRSLPVSTTWQSVTYGNGVFVAIAQSTTIAATSTDGVTWTQRTLPVSATWQSVAYGGSTFVAVASSTTIALTSSDGITWTQQVMPVSVFWQSVVYGGDKFAAVANGTTVAASSPDGVTWTQRVLPVSTGWNSVTYGGGKFVATGSTTIAASSTDGQTWTQRAMPVSATWQSVTYGNSTFVAVPNGVAIAATSPDGTTWTQRTLPAASTSWTAVAYGSSVFAAVTQSSVAATSSDGTTWTQRVLTGTSASPVADVYKSSAASNQFGADWYLILRRASDAALPMFYQVAEGYNATTHLASNIGGTAQSVVPVTGTFVNPVAPAAPDAAAAFGTSANLALTTAAYTYWYSANANRLVLGVKTTVEIGFYAGLYDDVLPSGVTQFPLMCAKIPAAVGGTGAIGAGPGNSLLAGGFTREPGQTVAVATNFEASIHAGYWISFGITLPGSYTPATTAAALYGNTNGLSRVMVGSARTAGTQDAVRGLLIGCVCSVVTSAAGDTITVGGKTYTRLAGPATTYGIYADQAL